MRDFSITLWFRWLTNTSPCQNTPGACLSTWSCPAEQKPSAQQPRGTGVHVGVLMPSSITLKLECAKASFLSPFPAGIWSFKFESSSFPCRYQVKGYPLYYWPTWLCRWCLAVTLHNQFNSTFFRSGCFVLSFIMKYNSEHEEGAESLAQSTSYTICYVNFPIFTWSDCRGY